MQKISIFWKIIFIILLCILVVGSIGLFVGLNFLLIMALSKVSLLGIQIKTNFAGFLFSIAIIFFSPINLVIGFILEVIKESLFKREIYKSLFDMVATYFITSLFIYGLDFYYVAVLAFCYAIIFELIENYEPLMNKWNKKNHA
ncbi:hypothetical protein NLX71_01620 [Paenibacillus sp. MZ04-78.2]|uniref:hypothetical protein n=1 Tax=Paenibacillus sp. MZ04-78.2 TaxID=2962034 RepID=UPI0020B80995|nr:hypothetical protein [Paenibacillus sp. MZ04-78.2]MCP3772019.1 hypothetical protein [Paenibacillus sp. MZ04-78.2]